MYLHTKFHASTPKCKLLLKIGSQQLYYSFLSKNIFQLSRIIAATYDSIAQLGSTNQSTKGHQDYRCRINQPVNQRTPGLPLSDQPTSQPKDTRITAVGSTNQSTKGHQDYRCRINQPVNQRTPGLPLSDQPTSQPKDTRITAVGSTNQSTKGHQDYRSQTVSKATVPAHTAVVQCRHPPCPACPACPRV